MSAQIPTEDIKYDVIKPEDTDAVIEMLQRNFFKDEPLNAYLDLGECQELVEYASKSVKDGCSFKATTSSGEIVGVCLNGFLRRPPPDAVLEPAAPSCEHEKFKKILGMMDMVESRFSVFDLFPEVEVALDIKILSVSSEHRGKGIANVLSRMTVDYVRDHGLTLINVLCSSHFSAQLMKKLKFESVFVLPLSEYVDANGEQILKPELPHVQAEVLVMRVAQ